MSEPVKIAVVIEGGCVSAVLTAGVAVEFVVIDYDTDGADPADLVAVPQDQPAVRPTAPAYVSEPQLAEARGAFVLAAHQGFAEDDGCPVSDPDCTGKNGDCHDACEPPSARRYRNHYECDQCGNAWQDEWECACNDKCGHCGAEIEPRESEEIEAA